MKAPVMRETCGYLAGLLDHVKNGERACGPCAYSEAAWRLAAEGIPSRPTPSGWLPPVTAEQATHNASVLYSEVGEYDQRHVALHTGQRRRHLRRIA